MDKKLIDNTLFRLLRWFYVEEAGEAVLFSQLTGSPLFLDSIQVYEFMMAIENEFRIVFTSADIHSGAFESLSRLSDVIYAKMR